MKKELYTLDEADEIWTAAARRGRSRLESTLSRSPHVSSINTSHETSALTK